MKKLIFGIAVFVISMYGIIVLTVNHFHPRFNGLFVLLILMATAGFGLCLWELFLASLFQRWRNSPVELLVHLNGKKVATLSCLRGDNDDKLIELASALPEVQQALGGKKIVSVKKSALVDKTLYLETTNL